jgi:hypothetical protein
VTIPEVKGASPPSPPAKKSPESTDAPAATPAKKGGAPEAKTPATAPPRS